MASILTLFALEECGGDPNRAEVAIRDCVRQSLAEGFQDAGQPGRLSAAIARLAFLAASLGAAVVIATTNYAAVVREAAAMSEAVFRSVAPAAVGGTVAFRYLSPEDSINPDNLLGRTISLLFSSPC
ncbi:MAG: hypothetical protein LBG60_11420 [Bifidobacteriaceae bacterium]|jgi:hypothetical protein|nr:hypothetical protein [Bifidobacteriaceae bacterium]